MTADATEGRIVVAEDHHPEGGLGSAVADALLAAGVQQLRLAHLSVSKLPGSGTTAELLNAAGIDAPHIAAAAAALVEESRATISADDRALEPRSDAHGRR